LVSSIFIKQGFLRQENRASIHSLCVRFKEDMKTIHEEDVEAEHDEEDEEEEVQSQEEGGEDEKEAEVGMEGEGEPRQMQKQGLEEEEEEEENEEHKRRKERRRKKLLREIKKAERRGVCYLSRIPPHLKPLKLRHLLSQYAEVLRIYLAPEG
jgi:ESF2/ABP1 family protein